MTTVGIIGFGRFGELLAALCRNSFQVIIVESDAQKQARAHAQGFATGSLESLAGATYIFLAVPISSLESVLQSVAPFVSRRQVVIDLCSVKVYPSQLMRRWLPRAQLLATHPMFGPDSAREGLAGLKLAFCPLRVDGRHQQIWRDFWAGKGVEVVYTTPEAHDKDVVYSQAFCYCIAKIALAMELPEVGFTIRSFEMLKMIARLSANDSEQLFHDVLRYNPYFAEMKNKFEMAVKKVVQQVDGIAAEQVESDIFSA